MTTFAVTQFTPAPRPAFGVSAQHQPRHRTKAVARQMREAKLAADLLPSLPEPGECVHCLMTGRYDLTQVIDATTALKPVRHLRIASLCFSRKNTAVLLKLLDAGRTRQLTVLVSEFFQAHNAELYEAFAADLDGRPGCRLASARSHCKVALFDFDDADGLVFEGSANLRTNRNREQLAVLRDRRLHDWHATWIDELVSSHVPPQKV